MITASPLSRYVKLVEQLLVTNSPSKVQQASLICFGKCLATSTTFARNKFQLLLPQWNSNDTEIVCQTMGMIIWNFSIFVKLTIAVVIADLMSTIANDVQREIPGHVFSKLQDKNIVIRKMAFQLLAKLITNNIVKPGSKVQVMNELLDKAVHDGRMFDRRK